MRGDSIGVVLLAGALTIAGCGRVEAPAAPQIPRAQISPESAHYWVARGTTRRHELFVDLSHPPKSNEALFVAIAMDVTSSQRPYVEAAKRAAVATIKAIHTRSVAAHIAVMTIDDHTKAVPRLQWRILQPFTNDPQRAAAAIAQIQTGLAGSLNEDVPEPYSCSLVHSVEDLDWGNGKRYLVFIGDSWPAVPDHCVTKEGLREVSAEVGYQTLNAASIRAIGLYARGETPATAAFFNELALKTSGIAIPLGSADTLPTAILAGLDESMTLKPKLMVPDTFRDRVAAVSDPERMSSTLFRFKVDLTTPDCVRPGRATIRLPIVYTDGASTPLGSASVVISASGWHYWPIQLVLLSLLAAALVWLILRQSSSRQRRRLYYVSTAPAHAALGLLARVGVAIAIVGFVIWVAPTLPEHDPIESVSKFWSFEPRIDAEKANTC